MVLSPKELHVKSRKTDVREARQIIMYFAKKMTSKSLAGIGNYFERDHATASHAIKTIRNMIDTNSDFAKRIIKYEKRLKLINIDHMISLGNGVLNPLQFEVLKLEKKVDDLKALIDNIKRELSSCATESDSQKSELTEEKKYLIPGGKKFVVIKEPYDPYKQPFSNVEDSTNKPVMVFKNSYR